MCVTLVKCVVTHARLPWRPHSDALVLGCSGALQQWATPPSAAVCHGDIQRSLRRLCRLARFEWPPALLHWEVGQSDIATQVSRPLLHSYLFFTISKEHGSSRVSSSWPPGTTQHSFLACMCVFLKQAIRRMALESEVQLTDRQIFLTHSVSTQVNIPCKRLYHVIILLKDIPVCRWKTVI